jgi:hypothetical protein
MTLLSSLKATPVLLTAALTSLCILVGCSTSPPDTISLASSSDSSSRKEAKLADVRVDTIKWSRTKPGCKGTCPTIELNTIVFPDDSTLSELIDHVLAYMTGVDKQPRGPYQNISEYTRFFWQTAAAQDSTSLTASVKEISPRLVVVELHTNQSLTGMAQSIPATQYLNWEREKRRVLSLDEALLPGKLPAFEAALKAEHDRWLRDIGDAKRDPATFNRMWPFQESDNFALMRHGLVVKYDAYSIAPASAGEPELTIPYEALRGIIDPQWIPADK